MIQPEKKNMLNYLKKTTTSLSASSKQAALNVHCTYVKSRQDTYVSNFNSSIERLALHWQKHDVKCISNTRDYFNGKDRVPAERYFSKDGIHLSRSEVKRLLDAINSATIIHVVDNYDLCVFIILRYQSKRVSGNLNSYSNHSKVKR